MEILVKTRKKGYLGKFNSAKSASRFHSFPEIPQNKMAAILLDVGFYCTVLHNVKINGKECTYGRDENVKDKYEMR